MNPFGVGNKQELHQIHDINFRGYRSKRRDHDIQSSEGRLV